MRVLLINNHHYVGGGSERVYRETANLLAEKGHEVAYLSTIPWGASKPQGEGLFYADEGYRAQRPDRFIYKHEVARDLKQFIRRWRPDVAHLHIFYGRLTSAVLRPLRRVAVPTVMSVHEYRMLCPTYLMRDWRGQICEKCADGANWHAVANRCNRGSIAASTAVAAESYIRDAVFDYPRFIDRFIFVSRFCRDIHLKYRPHIAAQADVLYNFAKVASEATRPSSGSYFLYVGRLSREKGLHTLLDAVADYPECAVRIAGTGPDDEYLRDWAQTIPQGQVKFLGHLDEDRLRAQIRGAKWVLVPSEWYENMPLAVIEAFAEGIPVVGAAIGGIPELVVDGVTGILFEPANVASLASALRKAWTMPAKEVDRLGHQARAFVAANCNRNMHYERLMEIYSRARRSKSNIADDSL